MKLLLILFTINWAVEYFSSNYIRNNIEERIKWDFNIPTAARNYIFN